MYCCEGIGKTETRQLTYRELLELLEQFNEIDGDVAVLTTVKSPFGVTQSLTLCKEVEM